MDDYSNAVRFPITKLVFLDRADRQRAAALLLDDRALYDPALGTQTEQATSLKQIVFSYSDGVGKIEPLKDFSDHLQLGEVT